MSRTTAEINLKVNARALGDLERAMDDAFDPSKARDTEGAVAALGDELEEAGGSARTMAESLTEAAESRQQFKRLRDEIKGVRQEARRLNRELERTAQLMGAGGARGGGGKGGGSGLGMGGGTFRPRPTHTEASSGGAVSASTTPGAGGGGDKTSQGYGAMAAGLSAIPYAGMALGAFLALGGQAYGSHLGREGARRGTYAARTSGSQTLNARSFEDIGGEFGYKPGEAQGMYGQLMSRAGQALGTRSFRMAMGAQQTYGVDMGTAGSLIHGMQRASGGGDVGSETKGRDEFQAALTRAVRMGLDGSELTAYMQSQSQMIQQQAELGATSLNMAGYQQAEQALAGRVGGFRAQRMTSQFATGVSDIGYRGGGGATEFLLASEAGFQPGEGFESYFAAQQRMQDVGSNPELMSGYLQRFIREGAGEHTNIAMVQKAYSAATGGQKLHADAARAFIENPANAHALKSGPGDAGEIGSVRGVHGDLAIEAGFEAQRADVGETVASAMQSVTESSLAMAEAMGKLAPIVDVSAQALRGLAVGAGVAADAVKPFMDALQKLADWISENLD